MKLWILPFLILISIYLSGQEKSFNLNQGYANPDKYDTTIPFEEYKGQIIIHVEIDDKTYRFIFDTGSPTIISSKLYKKLSPEIITQLHISDANDKQDSLNVVIVERIKIGNIDFYNNPVLVMDKSNFIYNCFKVDGIIGSNLVRKSVVKISNVNHELTLAHSTKQLELNKKNSKKLILTKIQSSPLFWLKIKGKDKGKVLTLFDSGMNGLMDIDLKAYSTFSKYEIFTKIKHAYGANTIGLLGTSNDTIKYKMIAPELFFAKTKLLNAPVNTTHSIGSRIGTDLLEYADVTLDYPNKRIYFTPLKGNKVDAYKKDMPIDPSFTNGKLIVSLIWRKDEVPNISKGDEILKVDILNCQNIDECSFLNFINSLNKEQYEILTQDSKGNTFCTIIKKK